MERARAEARPKGLAARLDFEMLGRQAEAMALRTVAVDDAVRAADNPQLVILGAGLDGRAWRMPELADVAVFERRPTRIAARQAGTGPRAVADRRITALRPRRPLPRRPRPGHGRHWP
ncbi:MAG: O-methyltransferase [uncultured Acidimicrobiales bacterium]|uniref:O-methyltransferase n=1 Tax=uncultured Acidimicrobiales bacterium TaxID=310071 RepID=A0A6J4H402_9ACTN|nr:MAG: O-methyltransferase [uncultured Acidimicrobiales bacterium]